MKVLHEGLVEVFLDESLSSAKKKQLILNGFKEHSFKLEAKVLKDVEKKVEEKRLEVLVIRCATTHTQLQESIFFFLEKCKGCSGGIHVLKVVALIY